MESLKLLHKSRDSKDRMQWWETSPQKKEKPRRQVQFEADKELGAEPNLPGDLAHFLVKGPAPEQKNAPSSTDRPSTLTKIPQHSPAVSGGAQPKF